MNKKIDLLHLLKDKPACISDVGFAADLLDSRYASCRKYDVLIRAFLDELPQDSEGIPEKYAPIYVGLTVLADFLDFCVRDTSAKIRFQKKLLNLALHITSDQSQLRGLVQLSKELYNACVRSRGKEVDKCCTLLKDLYRWAEGR
ncbi:MAG: hypothetical protein LBJ19_00450 [Holosporaceae bacterium]|nr:hypothetical protein [Holosporaceae bacterium]